MIGELIKGKEDYIYFIFRVFIGLLFFQHGARALLGWFGGEPSPLLSLYGLAGLIEFFGGLGIALGIFTRLAALGSAAEMAAAYLKVHAPLGLFPIVNQGELALLYFAAFLVLIAHGAGKWSLERAVLNKEIF